MLFWDGRKGRWAILIDCADRMVLAWRFVTRITAEDLAEMLREAVFRRFGEARAHAQGIEFLSDNGPEYTSHRFRPFVQAMGLIPCHTPRRSPQSNGLAEAFFGSFKRDCVYQACLETLEAVGRKVPWWIDQYNREAPHSALGMQSPAECYAAWLVKNKTRPVHKIKRGSTRRRTLSNTLSLLAFLAVTVWAAPSEAVRPFVTDDARIVDKGQLETESFVGSELIKGQNPAFTLGTLEAMSVTDWLQITAGGIGQEYHDKRFTVLQDLVFQPKVVVHRSFGLIPSVTVAPSLLIPTSGNRQLWTSFTMAHISWFLFTPEGSPDPYDNGLAIHLNIGTKSQYDAGLGGRYTSKLYWAGGFEVITFTREIRFLAEAFNGDPFSFQDEFPAVQAGFRWYKTPDVQWDVVWRGSRTGSGEGHKVWDNTVQIGLRVLFEVFK